MNQLLLSILEPIKRFFRRGRTGAGSKEQSDGGVGAEAPIRSAYEDRLRRVEFANRIADVLSELSLSEGRVFAIRGGWGFGKTSLKNLISERLITMEDGASWLDFNPWQWGDGDALVRALFSQIADRLGGEHSQGARARAEVLRKYGSILSGAVLPLKQASGSTAVISMVLTNASLIAVASAIGFGIPSVAFVAGIFAISAVFLSALGKAMSYFGRDRSADPLDKVRKTLETRLRELDRPLVVFVDDIDRLEPEQIRILLRQVKANANLPNIIFVLLFQSDIVEQALDPVAGNNGRAFLEKIVQATFDLPAVPVSVVHHMFSEELSKLAGPYASPENGFSQTRWGNVFVGCIQPFLRNMRDAKRLLSSIAVHMPLHVDGDIYEVNIIDFILLETLRVFEPSLHQMIFHEKQLLLQEQRFSGDGRNAEDMVTVERFFVSVSPSRQKIAKESIKNLFPSIEWAIQGMSYGDSFISKWLAEKRVCTARYFPRYFELQVADGEISERQFIDFIKAAAAEHQLKSAVTGIEKDGLLASLAAKLDESVDQLPVENSAVLLPWMFRIAEKLAVYQTADPFSSPWTSAWRATYWLLNRVPKHERGALVLEAFRKTEALSIAAILIHLSESAKEKKEEDEIPVLDDDTINNLKDRWLWVVRKRAAHGGDELIHHSQFLSLLYDWKNYTGSFDEVRAWIAHVIKTDEGFVKIVARMVNRGRSHTSGDRVSTAYSSYSKETIDDFIGVELAAKRCRKMDFSDFPEHEESLRMLSQNVEKWILQKNAVV